MAQRNRKCHKCAVLPVHGLKTRRRISKSSAAKAKKPSYRWHHTHDTRGSVARFIYTPQILFILRRPNSVLTTVYLYTPYQIRYAYPFRSFLWVSATLYISRTKFQDTAFLLSKHLSLFYCNRNFGTRVLVVGFDRFRCPQIFLLWTLLLGLNFSSVDSKSNFLKPRLQCTISVVNICKDNPAKKSATKSPRVAD